MAKVLSLSDISDNMRKDFKEALPSVKEAGNVKRLVMSSPKMNYIFGGGFPLGRIVELHGSPSSGKSVLSSYIGGQFQKRTDGGPKGVLYIDMEYTFDEAYANNVGLLTDADHFVFVQPLNGEEAFTMIQNYIQTGQIGLIIYDSITVTPTAAQMEDDFGKKTFGSGGLLFSEGLKKLNPYLARFKTSMIMLRQMRAKVGFQSYGPPDQAAGGGMAPEFYASWRARVSKGDEITDKTEVIGNFIKIKNVKSKIGFPKRTAELELHYGSGFSPDAEYIDFIIDLGIVKKSGSWISQDDWGLKIQGKDALLKYLQENKDIFEACKKQVNETFSHHSVLDEKDASEDETETKGDLDALEGE